MKHPITIREAVTERDIAAFWEQLHLYHARDIFPDPDSEDLDYFLGAEYHDQIMRLRARQQDRCFFLFFEQNEQTIGFAMPVIYTSEDGKCFLLEFCVDPQFRGNGTGRACARALLDWAKKTGCAVCRTQLRQQRAPPPFLGKRRFY